MVTTLKLLITICLLGIVVAACGNDGEDDDSTGAGESIVAPGTAPSPEAVNRLENQMEVATMTIREGGVVEDTITLTEDQPAVLRVTNEDDVEYRIEIPGLVAATGIAASDTTDVEFTTPNATDIEGRLLPAGDGEAVATFRVLIQAAGGVQP